MKKTVAASLVVVIALALAVVCAGCTSSTTPSPSPGTTTAVVGNTTGLGTSLGNATNITVVQGQNFTMQLQSNPSTGYHWEPSYNNSSITLVNRTVHREQHDTAWGAWRRCLHLPRNSRRERV